jgi:chromosome segregation ATPase
MTTQEQKKSEIIKQMHSIKLDIAWHESRTNELLQRAKAHTERVAHYQKDLRTLSFDLEALCTPTTKINDEVDN